MSKALLALALLVLIAHAACLPTTFADVDGINFALGVRDFDVARHQPHPPGYPVFIAAAKGATALLSAARVPHADVRALAGLSALAGALLIPLLFALFLELLRDRTLACCAALVTALSPLFWFNALRPLSDMSGLAVAVLAQALLVSVILDRDPGNAGRRLVFGALVAGLAIGLRSQTFLLTLPLLAIALVRPRVPLPARAAALGALAAAIVAWMVPLLIASGGPDAYLAALRNQAGEDFTGVVMLWTMRSGRVAIEAFRYTFLWPWGTLAAGWVVLAAAIAGTVRMALRAPAVLAIVVAAFAPYAVFHLLFQETLTTRYALPLVIPIALLAVYALAAAPRAVLITGAAALAAWSLLVAVPAGVAYGARPTPPYQALTDAIDASSPDAMVGMHAVMRRVEQLYHDNASGRVIRAPHGREVSALVERWQREPDRVVKFVADPRRSDLARLDPRARTLDGEYGWGFPELPLLGGVRPGEALLYTLRPPGWMLDAGWAVTAEVGGETARAAAGPHRRPAIAWIRAQDGAALLMIGGRNLGVEGGPSARIDLAIAGRPVHSLAVPPGFFFETRALPAGTLSAADAYVPLDVRATSLTAAPVAVGLEQFDLQPDGVPMCGLAAGWQEPEYDPTLGRTWHWMSDRATVWVRSIGRDLTLTLSAESPLRYFDAAPRIRFRVGDTVLAEITPDRDFTQQVRIPAALLAASGDQVVIESDKSFVPGGGDQRKLALRVYALDVD